MKIKSITLLVTHSCTNAVGEDIIGTATVKWHRDEDERGGQHTDIEANCDNCGWELEPSDEVNDGIDVFLDNVADSIEDAMTELGDITCRPDDEPDDNEPLDDFDNPDQPIVVQ